MIWFTILERVKGVDDMEKLHNIKGIFFDLGGTLLYPPSGSWMFSDLAYRYFPKDALAKPKAQEAMGAALAELHEDHLLHSLDEEYAQFYRYFSSIAQALPELGLTAAEIEAVTKDKVYNKADNYRLFDDTIDTLKALHGKYRLGIISDTWPSIVPELEHLDILKYFDCVTYSFEAGTFKPDPKMYRDALAKMALPAGETIFVDDLACNLEGARRAGINPVHICAMPGIEPAEGIPRIDRISALLDLLGRRTI